MFKAIKNDQGKCVMSLYNSKSKTIVKILKIVQS